MKSNKHLYSFWIVIFSICILAIILIPRFTYLDVKEDNLENYSSTKELHYAIDNINIVNKGKHDIAISGWAFNETSIPNDDKFVSLILVSDENTYSISSNTIKHRQDVLDSFSELKTNGLSGFTLKFQTDEIAPGIYQTYLYNHENNEDSSLNQVDLVFEKLDKDFIQRI